MRSDVTASSTTPPGLQAKPLFFRLVERDRKQLGDVVESLLCFSFVLCFE